MRPLRIRDASSEDAAAVLQLNQDSEEWTSPLESHQLQNLAEHALLYRVAETENEIAGFLLAMRANCGYENDNFEWFGRRYRQFLYIDRIVVGESFAGRRIGSALYDDVFSTAAALKLDKVVCEYTWKPLNVASQKFHQRCGFREVGRRTVPESAEIVSMQCRLVTGDARNHGAST